MWMEPQCLMLTGEIGIAHAQYDVIPVLGVESKLTFGFLIFPIYCATFSKLPQTTRCVSC